MFLDCGELFVDDGDLLQVLVEFCEYFNKLNNIFLFEH